MCSPIFRFDHLQKMYSVNHPNFFNHLRDAVQTSDDFSDPAQLIPFKMVFIFNNEIF